MFNEDFYLPLYLPLCCTVYRSADSFCVPKGGGHRRKYANDGPKKIKEYFSEDFQYKIVIS
jgi:hypothetical protein